MYLLISDANILIDLEAGRLLTDFFKLPYLFKVPDVLYYEELSDQHSNLLDQGLLLGELNSDSVRYAIHLRQKHTNPSMNDCFALALAKQEHCELLTGDKALRKAANEENIRVKGTLWVVEQLVKHKIITITQALNAYESMEEANRRLPWHEAKKRLKQLNTL